MLLNRQKNLFSNVIHLEPAYAVNKNRKYIIKLNESDNRIKLK